MVQIINLLNNPPVSENKSPHWIAENTYQISKSFAKLYAKTHILSENNEDVKNQHIALLPITKRIPELNLYALGITALETL